MQAANRDDFETNPDHGVRYCPPLPDTRTIFREMIAAELQAGRLTRVRRARIVRYASHLGLSPVEAGRLITECHRKALHNFEVLTPGIGLGAAAAPPRRFSLAPRVAIITGILLIIVWLIR